jgi:hypothetical protein
MVVKAISSSTNGGLDCMAFLIRILCFCLIPDAHPAIKAVSPQAPVTDEFMEMMRITKVHFF